MKGRVESLIQQDAKPSAAFTSRHPRVLYFHIHSIFIHTVFSYTQYFHTHSIFIHTNIRGALTVIAIVLPGHLAQTDFL